MKRYSFAADVHLGKLAKWLRILGIDTFYSNHARFDDLLTIANEQCRIVLSKNTAFSKKNEVSFLLIDSEDGLAQLKQVVKAFSLSNQFKPFTRCPDCNGDLFEVAKNEISSKLETNTRQYFNVFWQCSLCERIYWKGSHYERMKKWLGNLDLGEDL